MEFQSTHSLRSATPNPQGRGQHPRGFNPRTPCGVRPFSSTFNFNSYRFQSTHSLRSATQSSTGEQPGNEFQSTHSLRSATGAGILSLVLYAVSIHALLAECDDRQEGAIDYAPVSIHALLAECDRLPSMTECEACRFNPRTPCGVRPSKKRARAATLKFQSTHSLRSATSHGHSETSSYLFQSTHSLRSATFPQYNPQGYCLVSIHALLAECDRTTKRKLKLKERFQSTHSLRSATMTQS